MSAWRLPCLRRGLGPNRFARRDKHSAASPTVRAELRALLRETAQPVAVVTSLMPPQASSPHTRFHGATLSSFSSIAMDPHPLVAFSLRIPSRMATSLKNAHIDWPSHMVINILSAVQENVALQFSRVDIHPHPFSSISYSLTEEGLPLIHGSLGALSCKLVASSWPLHDLKSLSAGQTKPDAEWEGDGIASELFIAEVIRVESPKPLKGDEMSHTLPLLYHRRAYSTTQPLAPSPTTNPGEKQ
ncbi:unnamed protein product [Somion occarium]